MGHVLVIPSQRGGQEHAVRMRQVGRTRDALRMSDEGAGGIFVNSAGAAAAIGFAATGLSVCMAVFRACMHLAHVLFSAGPACIHANNIIQLPHKCTKKHKPAVLPGVFSTWHDAHSVGFLTWHVLHTHAQTTPWRSAARSAQAGLIEGLRQTLHAAHVRRLCA